MKHKMKEILLTQKKKENKDELTLEKARELLKDKTISDEKLNKIINGIKIFCKVAYELYNEEQNQKAIQRENNIIELHPEELKKAA